ncbi:fibroblast growth factor receptor-like [Stylophora pistillata]|uniref:fibroblast growth factor receptor-like n=1 Tax=Stylophora pistillata TaxID=50429 RepID=UPI000C054278|nr:fibroblast growth factor receptor-like [Stylophora pistillata]
MSDVSCNGNEPELASCARIDGKVKISPQCLSDGKGSQALCQPKNKKVLDTKELYFDIDSNEKLQCSVNNETSYTGWFINGVRQIPNSTSQRIRIEKSGELFIDKVQLSDAGLYECSRLEYVEYYIVYVNAKFTEDTPNQQTMTAGKKGTIRCSAEGKPRPQISWRKKDGKPLSKGRFTPVSNGNLHISRVKPEDDGTFICRMKQTKGPKRVTSRDKNIKVTVIVRPKVDISGASNLIIEGNSVNLTCEIVVGRRETEITWLKNNTLQEKGWSLLFPKIKKSDEGQYTCRAENDAGKDTKHVNISVKVPPRIKLEFKNVNIELHSTFIKKCNWSGDPEVHVNWTKDGVLLSTNNTLAIRRATFKDKGLYECTAQNNYGKANASFWIDVTEEEVPRAIQGSNSLWYYIGGLVAVVIVISLIACFFCKRRRTAMALPDQEQAIQMEPLNVEVDEWEIEVSRVLLQEVIGRGAFGAVWRALLSSPNGRPGNRTVAAKCFTPTAGEEGRKCLMREIELGKLIGENNQPNIVKFMGCVTTQIHPILIMEYMPCGDLLGYLRKCRGVRDRYYLGEGRAQDLTNYDLVMFAKQIAAGMVFLGSRGIIHRDLAARNVLLDNNYVCKVTDFGMAYQSFKYGHGNAKKGCLPIKWTAPEILLGNLAGRSTLSDVWSYGIVLYEIVTLGGIPYDGWSEGRVVAEVTKGYQLPKPDHIDKKLHDMMKRCWNFNPDFRPPFENLRQRMDKYIREETYEELLNLGAYDKKKYSRVEDLGDEDAGQSEEVAKKVAAKRLGKWSSARR